MSSRDSMLLITMLQEQIFLLRRLHNMGEIRLYAGGLSSSSLSVIAPFIRSNVTINNVTTLRIQADSLGEGGFFVVTFDGYIVSMSVSWRNFNRNFDMNIYVNGPLV